jgi:hypothetical protein
VLALRRAHDSGCLVPPYRPDVTGHRARGRLFSNGPVSRAAMCQVAWFGVARHALVELLLQLLLLAVASGTHNSWLTHEDVTDQSFRYALINTDRGGYALDRPGDLSLDDVLPCVIVSSPTPRGTPNATARDNLDRVPCDTQVNLTMTPDSFIQSLSY